MFLYLKNNCQIFICYFYYHMSTENRLTNNQFSNFFVKYRILFKISNGKNASLESGSSWSVSDDQEAEESQSCPKEEEQDGQNGKRIRLHYNGAWNLLRCKPRSFNVCKSLLDNGRGFLHDRNHLSNDFYVEPMGRFSSDNNSGNNFPLDWEDQIPGCNIVPPRIGYGCNGCSFVLPIWRMDNT